MSTTLETIFVEFASGFNPLADRRRYLDAHGELLIDEAIQSATALIARWRSEGVQQPLTSLRLFRNLLRRATEIGVDAAFVEFTPASREVVEAINALLRSDSPYDHFKTLVVNQRALSSHEVIGALHFLRAKFEDDPDKFQLIEACFDSIGFIKSPPAD